MSQLKLVFLAGHITPIRGPRDEPLDVTELDVELLERWDAYWLGAVRSLIEAALGLISEVKVEPKKAAVLKLRKIADAIYLSMIAPLLLEPVPVEELKLITAPRLFYLWLFTRSSPVANSLFKPTERLCSLQELSKERVVKRFLQALEASIGQEGAPLNVFVKFLSENTHARLYEFFLGVPADTRPGLNTSSLVVHLLTTAAIAYCLGLAEGIDATELELLRLAGLLHDIGKPRAWREMCEKGTYTSHAKVSAQLVRELLKGLLEEGLLNRLVSLVKYHHVPTEAPEDIRPLVQKLSRADGISSAEDRLTNIVVDTLAEALGVSKAEAKRLLKARGKKAWEEWLKLYGEKAEELRKATEKAVAALRKWASGEGLREEGKPTAEGELRLGIADIRHIQSFIMASEELKGLAAGSFIVDAACMYALPRVLCDPELYSAKDGEEAAFLGRLAPECILYAGGGVLVFLAPTRWGEGKELPEALKGAVRELLGLELSQGLDIALALVELKDPFLVSLREAHALVQARKLELLEEPRERPIRLGIGRSCELCGRRPAVKAKEGALVCPTCAARLDFANSLVMGLRARWEHLGLEKLTGLAWDRVSTRIMEFIAGHDDPRRIRRLRNLCLLKFDGNLAGRYMAGACSISDAVERSIRVDVAAKRALRALVKTIEEGVGELAPALEAQAGLKDPVALEKARLALGYLYMGGDDGLLLLPAWLALPAALILGEEFYREMGGVLSLAVGAVSAKAKYNIWSLLEAASALLEEAKDNFRLAILRHEQGLRGCAAFMFTEGGALAYGVVKSTVEAMRADGLSTQPYKIADEGDPRSLLRLLSVVLGLGNVKPGPRLYATLVKMAYAASREREVVEEVAGEFLKMRERMKKARDLAKALANVAGRARAGVLVIRADDAGLLRELFARAMATRARDEDERDLYGRLADLALELGHKMPIWDVFQVAKFLGGGAM